VDERFFEEGGLTGVISSHYDQCLSELWPAEFIETSSRRPGTIARMRNNCEDHFGVIPIVQLNPEDDFPVNEDVNTGVQG